MDAFFGANIEARFLAWDARGLGGGCASCSSSSRSSRRAAAAAIDDLRVVRDLELVLEAAVGLASQALASEAGEKLAKS
jgi:hypothetical protein